MILELILFIASTCFFDKPHSKPVKSNAKKLSFHQNTDKGVLTFMLIMHNLISKLGKNLVSFALVFIALKETYPIYLKKLLSYLGQYQHLVVKIF